MFGEREKTCVSSLVQHPWLLRYVRAVKATRQQLITVTDGLRRCWHPGHRCRRRVKSESESCPACHVPSRPVLPVPLVSPRAICGVADLPLTPTRSPHLQEPLLPLTYISLGLLYPHLSTCLAAEEEDYRADAIIPCAANLPLHHHSVEASLITRHSLHHASSTLLRQGRPTHRGRP